jgi:3-hydroxyisobutyrate dehydrogenase-like beta-hydroxyacid dehydrogenase
MGSGLAKTLTDHGVEVLTSLNGRSDASRARAASAGMRPVVPEGLAEADFLLSILPPSEAQPFAQSLAPILRHAVRKPIFADCNAISPDSVRSIAGILSGTGASFVDIGIIGLPPKSGYAGPRLYAAGEDAARLNVLNDYGLQVCVLGGGIGAASALKMAYAGITKGLIAVASSMLLAATRAGVADALEHELAMSESWLLESLARRIPDMLPKAYRWVAEMQQIRQFVGADPAAADIYEGAAKLYERLALDFAGERVETRAFGDFFSSGAR